MSLGQQVSLDEVCLPVKLFLGHAAYLGERCDLLLVPHLVSLERRAFTCPKFMGLPDLVRQALPGIRVIVGTVDIRAGLAWGSAVQEARGISGPPRAAGQAGLGAGGRGPGGIRGRALRGGMPRGRYPWPSWDIPTAFMTVFSI